jgi:hypothetical protein
LDGDGDVVIADSHVGENEGFFFNRPEEKGELLNRISLDVNKTC